MRDTCELIVEPKALRKSQTHRIATSVIGTARGGPMGRWRHTVFVVSSSTFNTLILRIAYPIAWPIERVELHRFDFEPLATVEDVGLADPSLWRVVLKLLVVRLGGPTTEFDDRV